jgi:hypothetical protein
MKPSMLAVSIIAGLLFVAKAASGAEVPQPKPGLWEMHTKLSDNRIGEHSAIAKLCMDAIAMAKSKQMGDDYNKKNCSKNETRQEGGQWVTDLVCKLGDSSMIGHEVASFTSDNAYHTENTISYDPPFAGRSRKSIVIDAKWLGTCKSGTMPEVVK